MSSEHQTHTRTDHNQASEVIGKKDCCNCYRLPGKRLREVIRVLWGQRKQPLGGRKGKRPTKANLSRRRWGKLKAEMRNGG